MTMVWVTGAAVGVADNNYSQPDRDRLREILSIRRTRFLDRGTLLAMAAIKHLGTRDPAVASLIASAAAGNRCSRTGVVVASYLANVDTVADLVTEIRASPQGSLLSPMLLPRVSPNVIASEIAIWLHLTGANYTVCNKVGTTSCALRVARLLLESGQTDNILLVAVEPRSGWVEQLWGGDDGIQDEVAVMRLSRYESNEGACALLTFNERPTSNWIFPDVSHGIGSMDLVCVANTIDIAVSSKRASRVSLFTENPSTTLDITILADKAVSALD